MDRGGFHEKRAGTPAQDWLGLPEEILEETEDHWPRPDEWAPATGWEELELHED